jgi:hypothetical protein
VIVAVLVVVAILIIRALFKFFRRSVANVKEGYRRAVAEMNGPPIESH